KCYPNNLTSFCFLTIPSLLFCYPNDFIDDYNFQPSNGNRDLFMASRRLLMRNINREELEKIKSGDAEAIRLKDYVDWFMSVRAEVDENDVFWPEYYGRWFSTLETEAQADYVHPFHYTQWYVERFDLGESDDEFSDTAVVRAALIERCGQLALEYFNSINKFDDYEYASDVAIRKCDDSYHLNFYGRLRVSPSRPGSPTILFFADVDFEDKVLECCTLDSEEFGMSIKMMKEYYTLQVLTVQYAMMVVIKSAVMNEEHLDSRKNVSWMYEFLT
ncbi:hypothetical protein KSS87_019684, partial [Heliosperma pusillum]